MVAYGVQASQTYRELCWNVGVPCETGLAFAVATGRQGACFAVLGHEDAFRFVLMGVNMASFICLCCFYVAPSSCELQRCAVCQVIVVFPSNGWEESILGFQCLKLRGKMR